MKTLASLGCLVLCAVFSVMGKAGAAPDALRYALVVTPEVRKAFAPGDGIEIRSITGTAEKFQVGGRYRIVGVCRQHAVKNAMLYLGNTAAPGADAISAGEGSSLFQTLADAETEFDITFTVLRPGQLHVSVYDLDNHDRQRGNAVGGVVLGEVAAP